MFSARKTFRGAIAAAGIQLALGCALSPAEAVGGDGTAAVCSYEAHETTTEGGNWVTPGPARNETLTPGTVTCVGTVQGRRLVPTPGDISYWYIGGTQPPATALGGEACQAWGGHGEMTMTLPTVGGEVTLTGGFTARGSGVAGLMEGTLGQARMVMVIHFRPEPDRLDEDCVRKPINHFIANAHGTLGG